MRESSWRTEANAIIVRVIMENPTVGEKELRRLISIAYPFGERNYHPYKIWLDAVQECLWSLRRIGKKPTKAKFVHEPKTLFD